MLLNGKSVVGMFFLINEAIALTCYHCQNIQHPRFCEYVTECSNDQVCGLERKFNENWAVVFNIGCMLPYTCQTKPSYVNGIHECYRCCSTDLCNSNGCGEKESTYGTGTMCFNCKGALHPSDCHDVTFCDSSKMCYLEKRTHFGELFYMSGCKEKHICKSVFNPFPIIGRRNIRRKKSTTEMTCCYGTLCNNDACQVMVPCLNGGTCHPLNAIYSCSCAEGFLGGRCEYADGRSSSFLIIFHEVFESSSTATKEIIVASEKNVNVSVLDYKSMKTSSFSAGKNITKIILNADVRIDSDGLQAAGGEVHTSFPVRLYGFTRNQVNGVSEGFLIIPNSFLSTEYVLPSFTVNRNRAVFSISPLYDNTNVTVSLKLKNGSISYQNLRYNDGSKIHLTLNKYRSVQLSHTSDLSGTKITASNPIAVVSGHVINQVTPRSGRSDQPFIEMILPTKQLDSFYILPHIQTRRNNTVRVQAVNSTKLSIKVSNRNVSAIISERHHFDFFHTNVSYIHSTENILVMIYPHEIHGNYEGDAFMMTIPGVNQYLSSYIFVATTGFDNFISVTIASGDVNGLILDGQSITNMTKYSINDGVQSFSTFSLPVNNGLHKVTHVQKARFGLWVYGNHQPFDTYGYPAGLAFKTVT